MNVDLLPPPQPSRPRSLPPIAVQYCLYAAPVTGRGREVVCDLMQVYTVESVPVTVDAVVMDAGAGQMSNWFEVVMSWRTGKRPLQGHRFRIILMAAYPFASTTSRGNPLRCIPKFADAISIKLLLMVYCHTFASSATTYGFTESFQILLLRRSRARMMPFKARILAGGGGIRVVFEREPPVYRCFVNDLIAGVIEIVCGAGCHLTLLRLFHPSRRLSVSRALIVTHQGAFSSQGRGRSAP